MALRRALPPLSTLPLLVLATVAAGVSGCDQPPSTDHLSAWTPADHDQEMSGVSNGQQAAPPPKGADGGAGGAAGTRSGPSPVDIAWTQACATCHGVGGHGDGPSGPTVGAPDLASAAIQDKFSDDDMVAVISQGKNKMPRFDLSDGVVKGLVAKIRSLRGH